MTESYRTTTVPVRGGRLAVGVWGPDDAPTVLAIHGITATHTCWIALAELMPSVRIVAPDLRGRGRSNALPGPWGMPTHADDIKALIDWLGAKPVVVLGHSMGAFVAVTVARHYPDLVGELVLIDGGLPIAAPQGTTADAAAAAIIGSAVERLSKTFASREEYRSFWQAHPAFASDWAPAIEAYVDYDLDGEAPHLVPSASFEAVAQDSRQLSGDTAYVDALIGLDVPVTFFRAPRGLLDEPRALYETSAVRRWQDRMPQLTALETPDVNHYTIVMAPRGAEQIAPVVLRAVARGATAGS